MIFPSVVSFISLAILVSNLPAYGAPLRHPIQARQTNLTLGSGFGADGLTDPVADSLLVPIPTTAEAADDSTVVNKKRGLDARFRHSAGKTGSAGSSEEGSSLSGLFSNPIVQLGGKGILGNLGQIFGSSSNSTRRDMQRDPNRGPDTLEDFVSNGLPIEGGELPKQTSELDASQASSPTPSKRRLADGGKRQLPLGGMILKPGNGAFSNSTDNSTSSARSEPTASEVGSAAGWLGDGLETYSLPGVQSKKERRSGPARLAH